jgi:hypothetical protein
MPYIWVGDQERALIAKEERTDSSKNLADGRR